MSEWDWKKEKERNISEAKQRRSNIIYFPF